MAYLFSRTNMPVYIRIKPQNIIVEVVIGLEPCDSPKCSLECPHICPCILGCVHYHHYPSLQIVVEYPQPLLHTFSRSCWILSIHVILLPIKAGDSLCVPQSTSHSFASTISTYCSAWAWDHDCHITVYDLSRQRRLSVVLVCIPQEITVNTIIFTGNCIVRLQNSLWVMKIRLHYDANVVSSRSHQ